MRTVIYARYSSDNQREESITAQLRAAREYCQRKGYTIVNEYIDEEFSAKTDNRPAFQAMISDAKAGLFDVLICHKIDRFARDRYDDAFYKRTLKKANVSIEYVEQNIDGSPESVILESVLVGMAEYYSKNLAREALKGMRENAYQAKHNGGIPPLGYDVNEEKKYVINEKEADIVRLIFERRAAGIGYGPLLQELNEKGYRTKKGGRFGKNSLHDLLRNKKYIGIYTFGRVATQEDGKRNNHKTDSNIIEIAGAIPAIVSIDVWEAVQRRMDEAKKAPGAYKAKEVYYLTGKVRCADCGSAMVGGTFTSRGNRYSYYKCTRSAQQKSCSNGRIKKEDLEANVIQYIDDQILQPDMVPIVAAQIKERVDELIAGHDREIKVLEKQKTDALRKIDNLLSMIEEGQYDDFVKQRMNENKARLADAEARIKQIHNAANAYLTEEQIMAVLLSFAEKGKGPDQIKALVETFVGCVTVSKDDIVIELRLSFDWWRRTNTLQKTNYIVFKKQIAR